MKNNIFESKIFIFNYFILLLLYFIGRITNGDMVYIIVCALGVALIINSMYCLNKNLKTKGCCKIIRSVIVKLI
ncbi:hypothetical protein SAMN04487886_101031 [Clostridium sp. DSM 8431]|nr:hypothetical protein SAMN04487886_101031 [Clostridium sp. DSM 8431]